MEAGKHLLAVAICSASIGLTGCFGGSSTSSSGGDDGGSEPSGSASATTSGQFIDSTVEGLRYQTDSGLSGVTGEDGEFDYREGDMVTFRIGGVEIGETEVSDIATPADLYPSDEGLSDGAIRLARLLQSIDEDFDPETGIRIPGALREFLEQRNEAFDFAVDEAWEELANDAIEFLNQAEDSENGEGNGDSSTRTLIDEEQAKSHLERSIARYRPIESCDGVSAGDQDVEDIIAGNRFAQLTDNGGVTFTLFEGAEGDAATEASFRKIESGSTETVTGDWSIEAGELKLGEDSVGTPCNAVTALLLEDGQESARWSMMREFRASTATGTYAVDGGFLTLEDGESGKRVSLEEGPEIGEISTWQVNDQGTVELLADEDQVTAELHLLDDETVKTAVLVEGSTAEESEITAAYQARSAIPGRNSFAGNVLVHEEDDEVLVLWFDRTGPGEVTEISNDHNGGSSARVVDGTWDYSRSEGVLSLDLGPDEQHDIDVFEYADRLEFRIDDDSYAYHRTLPFDADDFSATYSMSVPTENDDRRDMALFGNGQCAYLGTSPCDWDVSSSGRLEVSWSFNGEHGNVFAWAVDDSASADQRYVSVHIDRAFTDPEPGTMTRTGDARDEEPSFPEESVFTDQVLTYEQDGEVFILWFDRDGDGTFTEVANDHDDGTEAQVRNGEWSYSSASGQLTLNFNDGENVTIEAAEVDGRLELSIGDSTFEYFAPRVFGEDDFAGEYLINVPTEGDEERPMTLFENGQCDYLGTDPCTWTVTDDGQLEVSWTFGSESGQVLAWAMADDEAEPQRFVALHIDEAFSDPEPGSMIRTGDAPAAPPEDEEDDEDDNGDVDDGPVAGEPLDREELIQATSVRGDFYQARKDRFENTVLVELTESRPGGVTITRFDGDTVTRHENDNGQQETSSGAWDLSRDSQTGNTLVIDGQEIDDIRTDGHLVVGHEGFAASRVIPVEASLIEGQRFDLWMPEEGKDRQESLTIHSDGSCDYFADTCSWELEGGVLTLEWSHGDNSEGDVEIWRLANDPARYALVHNDFSAEGNVEPGVMEAQMSEVTEKADLIGQTLVDTRDEENARVVLEFSEGHYTEYSDDHFSNGDQSNKSFQSNWSFDNGELTLDGPPGEDDALTFSAVTQNDDQVRMQADGFTIYLDKTRAVNDEENWIGEYAVLIPSENDDFRQFAIHAGNDCGYTLGEEIFPCTWEIENGNFVANFEEGDFHIRAERLRRDDGEHGFLHINDAPLDGTEGDVEVGTMHRFGLPTALEDRLLEEEDVAGQVHGSLFGDPEDGEVILRRYFEDGEFWDAANDHFDNGDQFSEIMTGAWALSDGTLTTVFEDTDGSETTENLLAFHQSDDEVIMVRQKDRDTFALSRGADLDAQDLAGKTFDGVAPTDPEHTGRVLSLGGESCNYEYGDDQSIECDWTVGEGEFQNGLLITESVADEEDEGMTVIVHQLAANDTYVFIEIPAENDEGRSEQVGVLTVNN